MPLLTLPIAAVDQPFNRSLMDESDQISRDHSEKAQYYKA
jgi:hypothetical protein